MNNAIQIDVTKIPQWHADRLAEATFQMVRRIKATPEGRAKLAAKREEMEREKARRCET